MKIQTKCDNCKKLLREANAYYTLGEVPNRRLCKRCFNEWIGLEVYDEK